MNNKTEKMSLFKRKKGGKNFKFFERHISNYFTISGILLNYHVYEGPAKVKTHQDFGFFDSEDFSQNSSASIGDLFYLENRDRLYSDKVHLVRAIQNMTDNIFDLSFFSLSNNETVTLHFMISDVVNKIGRKPVSGDVVELTHLIDENDFSDYEISAFYVIEDIDASIEGYDPNYGFHIYQCQCTKMPNSQEYRDILERVYESPDGFEDDSVTLRDVITNEKEVQQIIEAVEKEADRKIPARNHEHRLIWLEQETEDGKFEKFAWNGKYRFYGDGNPPHGQKIAKAGTSFPQDAQKGDYCLRTDYVPNILFEFKGTYWIRVELNHRYPVSAANEVLKSFLNRSSNKTIRIGDKDMPQQQPLSQAGMLKPEVDEQYTNIVADDEDNEK